MNKKQLVVVFILSIFILQGCSRDFFFVMIPATGQGRTKTAAEEAWSRPPSKSAVEDTVTGTTVLPSGTTETALIPDYLFKGKTEKEIEVIMGKPISKCRVRDGGFLRQYKTQEGTITIFFDEKGIVSGWTK